MAVLLTSESLLLKYSLNISVWFLAAAGEASSIGNVRIAPAENARREMMRSRARDEGYNGLFAPVNDIAGDPHKGVSFEESLEPPFFPFCSRFCLVENIVVEKFSFLLYSDTSLSLSCFSLFESHGQRWHNTKTSSSIWVWIDGFLVYIHLRERERESTCKGGTHTRWWERISNCSVCRSRWKLLTGN